MLPLLYTGKEVKRKKRAAAKRRCPRNPTPGDLNEAQRLAVKTTRGPLLVLAGAGTGKTRVITYRIAHLLREGIPAESILAVTFTNKAAREMRGRVTALLGSAPKGITLSTFHSLGMRILRAEAEAAGLKPNFTIYDKSDQLSLMCEILRGIKGSATTRDARGMLNTVSLAKNRFALPGDLLERAQDDWDHLVALAYRRYTERLRVLGGVDFDDLILLPVLLLRDHDEIRMKYQRRFRFIMIDEYQDTNGSQYRFTRTLVGPQRNLCVVGDDDQSIYGFRGAEMEKILAFERDFPRARVVALEENYRSTASILNLANAVIEINTERHPKRLKSNCGAGEPVEWVTVPGGEAEVKYIVKRIEELHKNEYIPYEDMAILIRSSFQARAFEEGLRLRRIPYTLVGGQSYFDRKEIRDILAYWNVANNPGDDVSLLRIINFPRRGFGSTAISRLGELASSRGVHLLEALSLMGQGEGSLPGNVRSGARFLSDLFSEARQRIQRGQCAAMCRNLLERVDYRSALQDLYTDPLILQARWNAVDQLVRSVEEWEKDARGESFAGFLGAITLEAQDEREDGKENIQGLALMTLHSAKGLEFPVVFLVGVEEDSLPHRKSVEDGDRAIEEERRLFYVGITRARRRLILTSAEKRILYGREVERIPSRFLTELDQPGLFKERTADPDAPATEEQIQNILSAFRAGLEEN